VATSLALELGRSLFRLIRALRRPRTGANATVALDKRELRRLLGEPVLLRRAALRFDLAQLVRGHPSAAALMTAIPSLRGHLLGLWCVPAAQSER
jgi:hypothetical protein